MEKYAFKKTKVSIAKIELNDQGDYAAVSTDDSTLFDRFAAGYKHIAELADSIPGKLEEIEKQYEGQEDFAGVMEKTVAMVRVNVGFSEEAVAVVDGILGSGSVRKHFRDVYEEIPNFLPDADCFISFLDQLTPIMEQLFGRKLERQEKASKARMAKYQPQDYKKPQREGIK